MVYRLSVTNWMAFFAVNGPGEILDKRFNGFRESPNDFIVIGQWTARITGKLRGKEGWGVYYSSVAVDDIEWIRNGEIIRSVQEKKDNGEQFLDSFAKPECRCRVGFHWRCAVHGKWEG